MKRESLVAHAWTVIATCFLMACQTFHKLFISFSLSNGKAHLASKNKTSQITQFYGFLKTRKMCKLN